MGYSDFIRSGFLFLQVNGGKARKNVKDNVYVFVVLEGAVEATIHRTSYAVSTGGAFLVPQGNDYSIRNISDKDAKLFFTQARKEESAIRLNRPSSKSLVLADWILQRVILNLLRLRTRAFAWYWKNLARYQHYFAGRRLYFIFFLLGLAVRRLPFIGSPPILNIQLIRMR
ncbi:Mif2/CENP-C like-domain-containing protein [Lyophyllum atratum]|nr:Mif2/CENP-C like-domain-containing protein [Lyophyllum atratum]